MPMANRPLFPPFGKHGCLAVACLGLLLAQGCATPGSPPETETPVEAPAPPAKPKPDPSTAKKAPAAPATLPQTGQASWYGAAHHGKRTASGAIYNKEALTAAHPSLPFGTRVKVTNLSNGKSVEVEITDRGPFVGGRIIDLSQAAARALGMVESGTATVRLE
jgi:rare lipoprotein A